MQKTIKLGLIFFLSIFAASCSADDPAGLGKCGNGQTDGPEECDLGTLNSDSASCLPTCQKNTCGDGFTLAGAEGCDDGNLNSGDGCSSTCIFERLCGDGKMDVGEACDDGNENDEDACLSSCEANTCGDGIINPNVESCDDGVRNSDTGLNTCRLNCALPTCGDGVVDEGEQCDEGDENQNSLGHCRANCLLGGCGDGVVDAGEQCDEGDENSEEPGALCRTDCQARRCGDGVVDAEEQCDTRGQSESCNLDCTPPLCGDGAINESAGESCDEATLPTPECNDDCTTSECGDGILNPLAGETCEAGESIQNGACSLSCETQCDAGFGDCDGAQGCETATSDDPNNCGACGRSCGGAACIDGACQQLTVLSWPGDQPVREQTETSAGWYPLVVGSAFFEVSAPDFAVSDHDEIYLGASASYLASTFPDFQSFIDALEVANQRLEAPSGLSSEDTERYLSMRAGVIKFDGAVTQPEPTYKYATELPPGDFLGLLESQPIHLERFPYDQEVISFNQHLPVTPMLVGPANTRLSPLDTDSSNGTDIRIGDGVIHVIDGPEEGSRRAVAPSLFSDDMVSFQLPLNQQLPTAPINNFYHAVASFPLSLWFPRTDEYTYRHRSGVIAPMLFEQSVPSVNQFGAARAVSLVSVGVGGQAAASVSLALTDDPVGNAWRSSEHVLQEIKLAADQENSVFAFVPSPEIKGILHLDKDTGECHEPCDLLEGKAVPFAAEDIVPLKLAIIGDKLSLFYLPRTLAESDKPSDHSALYVYQFDLRRGAQNSRIISNIGEVFTKVVTNASHAFIVWADTSTLETSIRRVRLD